VRTDKVSTFHGQNLVAHLARETRLRGNNSLEALLRYIGGQWIYRWPVYRNCSATHFGYEGYTPSYNRVWCSPFCQFSCRSVWPKLVGAAGDTRMRIGLFGQFGSGNTGNDGSLEAMLQLLKLSRSIAGLCKNVC